MPAQTALRVVVIGAGLGGLAAALCLARDGHLVHVFEAGKNLSELGAGIQIPPNAARILDRWGLIETIEEQAPVTTEHLRRFSNGKVVGQQRRNTKEAFGHKSMVVHRADFQKMLFDGAKKYGVEFTFGKKLDFDDLKGPSSDEGPLRDADVIVAADGISSATRTGLFGQDAQFKPTLTGDTATRVILPREKLEADSNLKHLVDGPSNNVWMGPKRHVVAYTIRGLELYNVVLCGPGEAPVGKYNVPYDPAALTEEYSDFEPTVRSILSKADQAHRWTISEIRPLPSWTDGRRITLLGDAAHAMMPYAAQGAAQCMEDAAVLGICLSKISSKGDIPNLLKRYEQIRRPRVERVQEVARGNRFLYGLEDGKAQRERDERLSKALHDSEPDTNNQSEQDKEGTKPDSHAAYGTPEFSEWLYGVDVMREAEAMLDK